MNRLRVFVSRALDVFVRRRRDRELSEEIESHLELLTEQYMDRGLPATEARAAARRSFGGVEQVKEAYRDQRGLPFFDALTQDLRFSLRSLLRHRWVTVVVILTLAIGLGMNLAVFSVVKTVVLRPFPFADQERLVIIWEQDTSRDSYLHEVSYPNFLDWRAQSESFAEMAAMGSTFWGRHRFVRGDEPLSGAHRAVSHFFFDTLGVSAALGRTFLPEDDAPGAPPVMIVSNQFWRTELGSDPDVVGKSLTHIDEGPVTIVGVMPPELDYPVGTDVWTPLGARLGQIFEGDEFTPAQQRGLGVLFVIGRLEPGVGIEEAGTELAGIVQRLRAEYAGAASPGRGARVQPLVAELLGQTRPALLALWGAVGLVLLLVGSNVAALLLVRVLSRGREYSIKLALGAGRLRLVRELITEIGLVTLLGAALGCWLARAGIRLLVHLSASEVPRIQSSRLDSETVVVLAIAVIAMVGLVAIAPAALCGSRGGGAFLGDAGRGSTESRRGPSPCLPHRLTPRSVSA